jgi:hypothetical protein
MGTEKTIVHTVAVPPGSSGLDVPLKDTNTPERMDGVIGGDGGRESVVGGLADAIPSGRGGADGIEMILVVSAVSRTGLFGGVTSGLEVVLIQRSRQTEGFEVSQVLGGELDHGLPIRTKSGLTDSRNIMAIKGVVGHVKFVLLRGSLQAEEEAVAVGDTGLLFLVDGQRQCLLISVTSVEPLVGFAFNAQRGIGGDGAQVPRLRTSADEE